MTPTEILLVGARLFSSRQGNPKADGPRLRLTVPAGMLRVLEHEEAVLRPPKDIGRMIRMGR